MNDLISRDLAHIWHPCTQMKDHETIPLLEVVAAAGSYLHLKDGRKLIDAVSSWWCKSLGHQHPRIKKAIHAQLEKFEHVMLAGTTNSTIVELSEQLATLMPPLDKVLYASDGSCAVEMAMKLSLHAQKIRGNHNRTEFIALANAYHGETAGAMSVSELGIYRDAYQEMLFPVHFIQSIPYVSGIDDPLWQDCSSVWPEVERELTKICETTAALIVEPLVQGAGGMRVYSQDYLKRLHQWAQEHNIYVIADEIMTGFGRCGKMLACEYAEIIPDFVCLSKGLTAGTLPISVTLTHQDIYNLFYDDYATGNSFLHSHTHSGNALAASVASEVLNIMRDEKVLMQATIIGAHMQTAMRNIAKETNLLTNVRGLGACVAADLNVSDKNMRAGLQVYEQAVELGALLRPLGNTIYWLPPLTSEVTTINELHDITLQALQRWSQKHSNTLLAAS